MKSKRPLLFCLLVLCVCLFNIISPFSAMAEDPQITNIDINTDDNFHTTSPLNIDVEIQNPDNKEVKYRYSLDNEIIQDWTAQPSVTYEAAESDIGINTLKVDLQTGYRLQTGYGSQIGYSIVDTAQKDLYIFRRPVEQAK